MHSILGIFRSMILVVVGHVVVFLVLDCFLRLLLFFVSYVADGCGESRNVHLSVPLNVLLVQCEFLLHLLS